MITFYQHIEEIKKVYKITDTAQIASIKRWYVQGAKKIKAGLKRHVNTEKIYCDLVANQAEYQLPEYANRVFGVKYNNSGEEYPLEEVTSLYRWQAITGNGSQSGTPQYYRINGDDVIELFPKPSAAVTDGLEVTVSFKQSGLTADDVTTGTATVTLNNQTVTLSSSVVDQKWVGRYFSTTDGSHEHFYRISEYVSNTSFKLEQYYAGDSGSGRTYVVGDVVDIPEEYLDLVELYVQAKYEGVYRKARARSNDMMNEFRGEIKKLKEDYANPSKSRVVKSSRHRIMDTPYPRWWPEDGLS